MWLIYRSFATQRVDQSRKTIVKTFNLLQLSSFTSVRKPQWLDLVAVKSVLKTAWVRFPLVFVLKIAARDSGAKKV